MASTWDAGPRIRAQQSRAEPASRDTGAPNTQTRNFSRRGGVLSLRCVLPGSLGPVECNHLPDSTSVDGWLRLAAMRDARHQPAGA